MENKVFNCVDNFYQVKKSWGVTFGQDCAYRALDVQREKGYEIGYGVMLVNKSLVTDAYVAENSLKSYCMPYAWHAWCEDEGNIYDSCGALAEFGVDISSIKSVGVIDAPTTITNYNLFQKYIKNIMSVLSKKNGPDVVYIQGVGQGISPYGVDFMGDDEFNMLIDMIDEKYNITGTTENNIVKMVG
jgi:hypothetical protein